MMEVQQVMRYIFNFETKNIEDSYSLENYVETCSLRWLKPKRKRVKKFNRKIKYIIHIAFQRTNEWQQPTFEYWNWLRFSYSFI